MSATLKSSKSYAYKVRVRGVSPRCGIEQIREGGIGSSAYSQREQYLIRERLVPPTKRRFWGQCPSKVLSALWVKTARICYPEAHASTNAYATTVFETCSVHTHYGTPFLGLSAYKARVEGVSPHCGIEQIREGGIGSSAYSQREQYLIRERFVPPTKRCFWGQCPSKLLFALGEDCMDLLPWSARLYQCICDNSFWDLLYTHTLWYTLP